MLSFFFGGVSSLSNGFDHVQAFGAGRARPAGARDTGGVTTSHVDIGYSYIYIIGI